MRLTISVYQRKREGRLEWTALGLGPLGLTRTGKSPTKLQRSIADTLRARIGNLSPAELARLELVKGRRLKREHLELNVKSEGKRLRVTGTFPLVVEPRRRAPDDKVTIAYHPLVQERWFVRRPDVPLADQARRFLSKALAGWSKEALDQLVSDGKDVLRAFSFTERGPQLVDSLPDDEADPFADLEPTPSSGRRKKKKKRYGRMELRAVGENVTARVADGLVSLGRPREPWRKQLAQLLNGPRKTPVVLLGPPGSGKTTLLHRWTKDLLVADDYDSHRNLDEVHEVWRIGARRILAGMSFVGDWEKRCVQLVGEARDPRVVLWVEDLHTFGRAGRTRDSDRTLADLFRGPLARGELTMVAEATEAQWHRLREDAPALADRFTTLRVTPTDVKETLSLVLHEARALELTQRVAFGADAYRAVLSLGRTLHPNAALPGVAIDLIRKLAADAAFDRDDDVPVIDADAALAFLSRRTGLPEALLRPDGEVSPDALRASFSQHVLGQEEAVRAAVDLVTRIRAGLTDPERPFATYLFTGPTGTGKTQMAKTIAGFLYGDESRLVRVDMGEMSGPDAVPRLIGDRFHPRGLLTDAVREQPFSVVLLDEVEKAHPAALQLLLQLLDEGRLTDAGGDTADFRKSVIVMTSNLGAKPRAAVGFGESARAILHDVDRAVRDFFPPELFNRIDRVVRFAPLTPEVAERVTEKELAQMMARRGLTDRKVFVFAHPTAIARMAGEAFDERGGARSVKRFLEAKIGSALADELAGGSRARMRVVRVYGGGDAGYRLHVDELTEAEPVDAEYELEEVVGLPTSALRKRLPALLARVRDLEASDEVGKVRARMSELVERVGRGDPKVEGTLYQLDLFASELKELRETLEGQTRGLTDVDLELAVDERRPAPPTRDPWMRRHRSLGTTRHLRRSAFDRPGALSRTAILRSIAEVALLSNALSRIDEPAEHRVLIELTRVGRGRRPPSYEREGASFFEWLAEVYARLRGECVAAAARLEDGALLEGELAALLAERPRTVTMEVEGVAVRSLFEGETGCHVWSSLLSGAEIVKVRVFDGGAPKEELEALGARTRAFEAALDRGDDALPEDPAGLTPAVRAFRFDPPDRPGEGALLEVEDYVTGQVLEQHARTLEEALSTLVWLRASRRRA